MADGSKHNQRLFTHPVYIVLIGGFMLALAGCAAGTGYDEITVSDRRMNLRGLEAVSIQYLNEHPKEFHAFSRILTAADDALGKHETFSRGTVMRWISRELTHEGFDESMPVYRFLKTVYLEGWEGAYLTRVDGSDREFLFDLISSVMGGMHLCTTCSTAQPSKY